MKLARAKKAVRAMLRRARVFANNESIWANSIQRAEVLGIYRGCTPSRWEHRKPALPPPPRALEGVYAQRDGFWGWGPRNG
ncbi:MAG: hypothetical protein KA310_03415 [Pseudomonadales bacterium]|nr:hypothetical protein [Pseudomonadales bacterium]